MKRQRAHWTTEEEAELEKLHSELGNKWDEISQREPFTKRKSPSQIESKYRRLHPRVQEGNENLGPRKSGKEEEEVGQPTTQPQEEFELGVPDNRRDEILEYLKLWGYKPGSTILQVHIPGKFGKKTPSTKKPGEEAKKRYGGTTFVVIGRTHDSTIKNIIKPPASKEVGESYIGYLWHGAIGKSPHEALPLDFTPNAMHYPDDWNDHFDGSFLICMHVPSSFAKEKNQLNRSISREVSEFLFVLNEIGEEMQCEG